MHACMSTFVHAVSLEFETGEYCLIMHHKKLSIRHCMEVPSGVVVVDETLKVEIEIPEGGITVLILDI